MVYYPSATYRIQLNSNYTFSQLATIIDYLDKLGISTIYASPITTATKGSTHGYDVCNPDMVNPEIGTLEELVEIGEKLSQKNMGWLQDIVPNHMAFTTDNARLIDMMERGQHSPYYQYFDINWNHFDPTYRGKLMVPFIGKDLNEAIDNKEIQLVWEDDIYLTYFDAKYPVAFDSIPLIFSGLNNSDLNTFTDELSNKLNGDKDEWNQAKQEWLKAIEKEKKAVEQAIKEINDNASLLREFISKQCYILTWFAVTEKEIDFRRFFTVNQLICLRMEDEFVFGDYHRFIFDLYKKGLLQGLRIDHVDGLYHPQLYIERLRKELGDDCYLIAEKILEYNEDIARDWDMQGTSGYEFLSFTNQLLTNKQGAEKLLSFYQELVPQASHYEDVVFEKKYNFLHSQMGGELENLLHLIEELNIFSKEGYDKQKLKDALSILMACFPVYRVYPDAYPLHERAMRVIAKAFAKAEHKAGDAQMELALLKTVFTANGTSADDNNKLLFLMRLMQFTGPLAAKGVEDTTFYVYNPLISHNEVGDSPAQLGITIDAFHQKMQSRQQNNPYSLNATSTHDTKRGEDGRMRINALAAMPDEWIEHVNNWRQINTPFIKMVHNKPAPSTNDEYFIYQSLIGAFPEDFKVTDAFKERSFAFLEKALREAKVETTYSEPDAEYEEACKTFLNSLLDEQHSFLQSFIPFLEKITDVAMQYSLAQTVIKITAPGIPDIYQGCELWDISYVDPDNRRAIDYDSRINYLNEIISLEQNSPDTVLSFLEQYKKQGRQKLYTTYKTLNLRRQYNDVFLNGDYLPLQTTDAKLLAYARRKDAQWIIVVVPFIEAVLSDDELSITLPQEAPQQWKNIFTGETLNGNGSIKMQPALRKFPVTVIISFSS